MSNVKTITRAQAIEFAYDVILATVSGDGFALAEDNAKAAEVLPVLKNMHDQLVKPRAKAVSKARLANEGLAVKLAAMLAPEGNTSKEIVGFGIPEVMSTQKAVAVMRVAIEKGLVRKVTEGKAVKFVPVTE